MLHLQNSHILPSVGFCRSCKHLPVSFVALKCETGAVGERGWVARGRCRHGCIVLLSFAVNGGEHTAVLGSFGPCGSRRSRHSVMYGEFLFGCTLLPHTGEAVPSVGSAVRVRRSRALRSTQGPWWPAGVLGRRLTTAFSRAPGGQEVRRLEGGEFGVVRRWGVWWLTLPGVRCIAKSLRLSASGRSVAFVERHYRE